MTQMQGNRSIFFHWTTVLVLYSLYGGAEAGWGKERMKTETSSYRVELTGCVLGSRPATKIPTRECAVEVTDIKKGEQWTVHFGKEYLGRDEDFNDMRIVDDILSILTDNAIIILDLQKGEEVKLFACLSADFSPSRDLILFDEWRPRYTPPEMQGRVISVIDLSTLSRYTVFPNPEKFFELPITSPGFENYIRPQEKDPTLRCFSSHTRWSPNGSKIAFACSYSLSGDLWPAAGGASGQDVVVVFLPPNIEDSTFKRFKISDRLYTKDVDRELWAGANSIKELRWLSDDNLEIVAESRDWLHSGATINVVTDEFLIKD